MKLEVVADNGTRQITLVIDPKDGVPDLTPEESNSIYTYRPFMVELEYTSEGNGKLALTSATTVSRMVNKETGQVQTNTKRQFRTHFTDLAGKGGIHKAITPPWLVDLAKKYGSTPDAFPRR